MDNFLTLSPELIATGKVTREQITNLIMQSATECDLLPLDKLRFYRTLEKAAAEAAKAIDEKYGAPITEVAVEHAESLPQLHEALAEGKKEFVYNGCTYQYKEDSTIDLSDYNRFKGEDAVDWRKQKAKLAEINVDMSNLRSDQKRVKAAMSADEAKYIAKHPDCPREVTHSIAVL